MPLRPAQEVIYGAVQIIGNFYKALAARNRSRSFPFRKNSGTNSDFFCDRIRFGTPGKAHFVEVIPKQEKHQLSDQRGTAQNTEIGFRVLQPFLRPADQFVLEIMWWSIWKNMNEI